MRINVGPEKNTIINQGEEEEKKSQNITLTTKLTFKSVLCKFILEIWNHAILSSDCQQMLYSIPCNAIKVIQVFSDVFGSKHLGRQGPAYSAPVFPLSVIK